MVEVGIPHIHLGSVFQQAPNQGLLASRTCIHQGCAVVYLDSHCTNCAIRICFFLAQQREQTLGVVAQSAEVPYAYEDSLVKIVLFELSRREAFLHSVEVSLSHPLK